MKRYVLIAMVFLLIAIVIGVLFGALNRKDNNSTSGSLNTPTQTELTNCEPTETGWSCGSSYEQEQDKEELPREVISELETIEQTCIQSGGRYSCPGLCLSDYPRYCDLPLDDAGVTCASNDACAGSCVVTLETAQEITGEQLNPGFGKVACSNEDCTGACSEYVVRGCDEGFSGFHIIHNGIVFENGDDRCF